jgi:hypothetical protein
VICFSNLNLIASPPVKSIERRGPPCRISEIIPIKIQLPENKYAKRRLPKKLILVFLKNSIVPLFILGQIDDFSMNRSFNCGID